ncbi:TPA: host cell division inhibitor Icd-like protein [Yersinia enterocolitica]|uniref:Host cell division inhibitor Icd-like protein n=2 Tax=Yersinia TaxID=629 RepID=A0AAD2Z9E5_YEREN|nr:MULTISPECIES: host cell division inhibitor Icd-like protein [Yersinia]EKN3562497.1 host cell division inhibitor Icd-like protein [Yersinia enterocolitica]EKN3981849.1 host cell division inhibitor Icd-like protein [Yersinia enterocolitica]EKN6065497.1 host cell division inhibitor Icd-like protein [Yersinia enterocolitica]EKN6098287.1 host cell division inhibitor Icd-like protein [Yersinia enterocolitica]ELI7994061.1 host cell division inhibitor Icd-like protein [Yersinia enterocolitica]
MNNLSNCVSSALVPRQRNQSLALNTCDGLNKVETDSILTVFIFATIKRSDVKAKPVMMRVTARSYKEAQQQLIRDYVISFAGRIPALEKMA